MGLRGFGRLAVLIAAVGSLAGPAAAATEITLWSSWPDEPAKQEWVTARVHDFEAADRQCTVRLDFIPKADIYTRVRWSMRTGQAQDIFYMEQDEPEFMAGGFLEPLDPYIDMAAVEDWAKQAWTLNGKLYGLPVEAYTVELYYNKELMRKVGAELPASFQMTEAGFADLVRRGVAAGITPVAAGIGDRPFPGGLLLFEALLRKLGPNDYARLLNGALSFKDPRVAAVMTWDKGLIDAGAYPKRLSTLKLGEAQAYFYQTPGALTFPDPSWFAGHAFAAPESGGMPADFPLGIMQFPAMDGGQCPECKTLAIGGSFVLSALSKHKDCAGALLRSMANVENGTKWIEQAALQTGIKSDAGKIRSPHAAYLAELSERDKGAKFFLGTPLWYYRGKCAETYAQVMNKDFPAGLLSVSEAADRMDAACLRR